MHLKRGREIDKGLKNDAPEQVNENMYTESARAIVVFNAVTP